VIARELISQAEELGITLRVVGDKLRLKAQLGVITPAIKADLANHKFEIMQTLTRPRVTRLYHVVVNTDGVHKGMTVIDPSGDDMKAFSKSCRSRFGVDRVISIEPRR